MPNPFCGMLSNGYSFTVKKNILHFAPCCLFKEPILVSGDIIQLRQSSLDNITGWTQNCDHCHVLESAGQQSLRQTTKDWIDHDVPDHVAVMIDLNLDQNCNAACVICDEHSSSLWQKEKSRLGIIPIKSNTTTETDPYIETITSSVSMHQLRYVKFFGGEPLFTDTHIKFLEKIPNPDMVTVHYTTNGSIFPSNRVMSVWEKFRCVIFAASIDGIENQFNYVRWPLPWHKVSRNLARLKAHALHNMLFRIEFTANFLNAFYFDRLEHWVTNHFAQNAYGDRTEINIHDCYGSAFDFEDMPLPLRQMMLDKYPEHHTLHNMVRNLQPNSGCLEKFKQFTTTWDHRRNLRWQDCFPEIVSAIE